MSIEIDCLLNGTKGRSLTRDTYTEADLDYLKIWPTNSDHIFYIQIQDPTKSNTRLDSKKCAYMLDENYYLKPRGSRLSFLSGKFGLWMSKWIGKKAKPAERQEIWVTAKDNSNNRYIPYFTILITLVQTIFFANYASVTKNYRDRDPVIHNDLIFQSESAFTQPWRLFTYIFLHCGWEHFLNNIPCQLIIGCFLEIEHGWWRTMIIYFTSVIAGPVGNMIFDHRNFVVMGSSSAIFGLGLAHLANIILNHSTVSYRCFKLTSIFVTVLIEIVLTFVKDLETVYRLSSYIYTNFIFIRSSLSTSLGGTAIRDANPPNVSEMNNAHIDHVGHLTGSLVGFFIGLVTLKIQEISKCNSILTENGKLFRIPKWKMMIRVIGYLGIIILLTSCAIYDYLLYHGSQNFI